MGSTGGMVCWTPAVLAADGADIDGEDTVLDEAECDGRGAGAAAVITVALGRVAEAEAAAAEAG